MLAFTQIMDKAIADAKQKGKEDLKANLEVFLKEKYGITLTDDDWGKICELNINLK